MDYNQIEIDFIDRTIEIMNSYNSKNQVTLLLNCCLGLIVLPKERHFNKIPDKNIPENGILWGISRKNVTVDCEDCGYNLRSVIRRIRNGLCHFKIESIPDEKNQIDKLVIKDRGKFKVELTINELKELALSFANKILKP